MTTTNFKLNTRTRGNEFEPPRQWFFPEVAPRWEDLDAELAKRQYFGAAHTLCDNAAFYSEDHPHPEIPRRHYRRQNTLLALHNCVAYGRWLMANKVDVGFAVRPEYEAECGRICEWIDQHGSFIPRLNERLIGVLDFIRYGPKQTDEFAADAYVLMKRLIKVLG